MSPLQNRVDPWGRLFADDSRGLLMGNRGGALHDDRRRIVRDQASRAWITCRTAFKGRRREVMAPGRYTELFFLDEATALAAGHRPCYECRRPEAARFVDLWRRNRTIATSLPDLDARLSEERRVPRSRPGAGKRAHRDRLGALPDGTVVELDAAAWLVAGDRLLRWTSRGYDRARPRDAATDVWVLTPPTTVAVLRAGYRPVLHPTATAPGPVAAEQPRAPRREPPQQPPP